MGPTDITNEVYQLLQIATLAQQWPELHPIRDRALEKLRGIAKEPAHTPPEPKTSSAPTQPVTYRRSV